MTSEKAKKFRDLSLGILRKMPKTLECRMRETCEQFLEELKGAYDQVVDEAMKEAKEYEVEGLTLYVLQDHTGGRGHHDILYFLIHPDNVTEEQLEADLAEGLNENSFEVEEGIVDYFIKDAIGWLVAEKGYRFLGEDNVDSLPWHVDNIVIVKYT